ncbi:MAG: hypothetical protein AB8G05_22130 [Oligoflexales bacterium]
MFPKNFLPPGRTRKELVYLPIILLLSCGVSDPEFQDGAISERIKEAKKDEIIGLESEDLTKEIQEKSELQVEIKEPSSETEVQAQDISDEILEAVPAKKIESIKNFSSEPIQDQNEEEVQYQTIGLEFTYGSPNPEVDYLFVIDNSVSMNRILDQVNKGFKSILEEEDIFSINSKVAVMNTMIGQLASEGGVLTDPSVHVRTYPGIDLEPGFLSLVDEHSYLEYINSADVPQDLKNKWPLKACQSAWFDPTSIHADGHFCFEAATQISATALIIEAGIKAFEQLLDRNVDTPVFRDDAIVNVIFVSDTHDPGKNMDQDYLDSRLNYQDFFDKLAAIQPIKDLKFHAIAPTTSNNCSSEQLWEESYFDLSMESNGQVGDACFLDDYRDLMKQMIVNGRLATPSFKLDKDLIEILSVKIDGIETIQFEFNQNNHTLTIDSLNPFTPVDVSITIKKKVGDDIHSSSSN